MRGVDRNTGKALSGLDHLRQSIADVLTTPIGSRVMRRDYGSRLFELADAPINRSTLVALYAATADALGRWEPRLRVRRVQAESMARRRALRRRRPVAYRGLVHRIVSGRPASAGARRPGGRVAGGQARPPCRAAARHRPRPPTLPGRRGDGAPAGRQAAAGGGVQLLRSRRCFRLRISLPKPVPDTPPA